MKQSELFVKTLKEAPHEEVAANAKLLIRAGYIDKLMAGVYSFLPLGLRTLTRIENIVRGQMNAAGGQEVLMPALHPLENYVATGRENIDVLFRTESAAGNTFVLGQSHEEVVVPLVQKFVRSYRDLPRAVYQIQTKFRNELRAKSGIFRGREFLMKDMYSFHADEREFESFYEKMAAVYHKVFERAGIGETTFRTYASGGTFSKYSHEFQTVTEVGEDTIYLCESCRIAVNKEIRHEVTTCPQCGAAEAAVKKSIEVGNIFPLKTRFSDAFGLAVKNAEGADVPVIMGCYGIGISRLMGAIAEIHHDEKGLVWPESVAPFPAHVIALPGGEDAADGLYRALLDAGIEVLYDERGVASAGEKFADADLIGIPLRIVASAKTAAAGGFEMKRRRQDKTEIISEKALIEKLKAVAA